MPVVLDGVVGAAWKQAGDHGPFVSVKLVRCKQPILLFFCEWPSVDPRIQLIEPS
jgi:hypothetical protein